MSQLNVDTIKNRLGTAGPTTPSLTVTNDATVGSAVVGSAVTINSTGINVTGVVTATSFIGNGSLLTGITATGATGDGQDFNTGITSSRSAFLTGIGETVLTLPSTAGKEYIIYSIHAANVGLNTEVNVIGAFDFNGRERSYFAYNIPIPTGMAVELLNQPQILNPSDMITMRSTDYDRVGINSAVQVYITYQEKTATEYFGLGFGPTIGITTTAPIGIYTATTYPAVLQSIRLTNTTDLGGYPVSVIVTSGVTTRSLVDNLVVPKYASVELLETPKRLNQNDILQIQVDQLATVDVQISGKVITS